MGFIEVKVDWSPRQNKVEEADWLSCDQLPQAPA